MFILEDHASARLWFKVINAFIGQGTVWVVIIRGVYHPLCPNNIFSRASIGPKASRGTFSADGYQAISPVRRWYKLSDLFLTKKKSMESYINRFLKSSDDENKKRVDESTPGNANKSTKYAVNVFYVEKITSH